MQFPIEKSIGHIVTYEKISPEVCDGECLPSCQLLPDSGWKGLARREPYMPPEVKAMQFDWESEAHLGELVHLVDLAQVFYHKEQFGCKLSQGQVNVALLLKIVLQNCRLLQRILDRCALGFCLVEGIQKLFILENVPCGRIELIQKRIFQV